MAKGDSLSVDLDGTDFSMGYAKGFNEIFYGGPPIQGRCKRAIAAPGSLDECLQPAVKVKSERDAQFYYHEIINSDSSETGSFSLLSNRVTSERFGPCASQSSMRATVSSSP